MLYYIRTWVGPARLPPAPSLPTKIIQAKIR